MANRYYLLSVGTQKATRLDAARSRLGYSPGIREQTHEVGHECESKDGTQIIIQGATTDVEHGWFTSQVWVTVLGDYDPVTNTSDEAVRSYLRTNTANWSR